MTASRSERYSSIRVHVDLRGADIALLNDMGPAEIWYFVPHRDLPPVEQLPGCCIRVTPMTAVWRVFKSRAQTIEIPEPLWARFLPVGLTLMLAARLSRLLTGQPRRTVFYALENNEPEQALFGRSSVPGSARRLFVYILGFLLSRLVDRVAFGSPSALRTYEQIRSLKVPEIFVVTELPARPVPDDEEESSESSKSSERALFVGALELRKGIGPLMRAWERVERDLPQASITIVGSGPLETEVQRWVASSPGRRAYLGQINHVDLSALYARADVLVAPSIRDGRWREQIGLQLSESLSNGLTLVVSDETGLAAWLARNGHRVVPAGSVDQLLAPTIVSALRHPLQRSRVRASLPPVHGRVEADRWLHRQNDVVGPAGT